MEGDLRATNCVCGWPCPPQLPTKWAQVAAHQEPKAEGLYLARSRSVAEPAGLLIAATPHPLKSGLVALKREKRARSPKAAIRPWASEASATASTARYRWAMQRDTAQVGEAHTALAASAQGPGVTSVSKSTEPNAERARQKPGHSRFVTLAPCHPLSSGAVATGALPCPTQTTDTPNQASVQPSGTDKVAGAQAPAARTSMQPGHNASGLAGCRRCARPGQQAALAA